MCSLWGHHLAGSSACGRDPGQRIPRSPHQKLSQLERVILWYQSPSSAGKQGQEQPWMDQSSVTEARVDMREHSGGHTPVQIGIQSAAPGGSSQGPNSSISLPAHISVGVGTFGCIAKFILPQLKPLLGWKELHEVFVLQEGENMLCRTPCSAVSSPAGFRPSWILL